LTIRGPLDLQHSIEHIQKQCPDFSVEEIEGHVLFWIESGYTVRTTVPRSNWRSLKGSAFNGPLITRDGRLRGNEPR